MRALQFNHFTRAGLLAAVATLGLVSAAQARDNLNWSVGMSMPGASVSVSNAPAVVVPAPVVIANGPVYVQPRPMYVATGPVVVQGPAYLVQPVEYREGKGHKRKGWHKSQHAAAYGRSGFWQYDSGEARGATVMVQAAPHVWVR